jgi:replicative DNA helicase
MREGAVVDPQSSAHVSHQPPQNTDAEASLLGAILIDSDAVVKIADIINVEDFYDPRHARIYEATTALYEKHSPIDVLTLSDQLKSNGLLDMVGGAAYLTELTNYVPTAAHVEQYAEIVAQKAVRRRLIKASQDITGISYDESKELRDLIEEAETRLFQVSQQHIKQSVVSIETVLAESFERLDDLHKDKNKLRGVPTGFKDMDAMLAGLQRSDLFILAARPSMGKAQPLDAKILTTNGWTTMGEIKIGDQLASIDGQESKVVGVFPQGEKQIYKVTFSDGRSTEACADHLWEVHYRTWDTPRVLTTEQLISKLGNKRYQKRLWINTFTGEFGHNEELPILPWALGLLLGKGDFNNMRFSTASTSVLRQMSIELGKTYALNHAGRYDYSITTAPEYSERETKGDTINSLKDDLQSLGLWGKHSYDKFIPEIYKTANRKARLAILQGLLDADGWVEKHGAVRFASSSEQLTNDVVELARSLGAWATINKKDTTYTYNGIQQSGLPSFVATIVYRGPKQLFTLKEKVAQASRVKESFKKPTFISIEPVRQTQAQCIKVSHPAELYITDNYVTTHNTAFSLNLAHNVAKLSKQPVLFFSLEMSKEQLVDRLLSMESGVDAWALRTGNLTDADFEKIGQAMGELSESPIYIDDSPGITVSDLRTKARREAHIHPLGLIVVDYLQLMSGGAKFGGEGNRVQEISEISRGLKGVARELNVPLIALSQLSRSVESRSPQIPQLADLRESGSIEQDADVVAFIYREDYYNPETDRRGITDILIKKHRNGPTGGVELYFDREKQRFRSVDTHHSDPFE